MSFTSNPHLNGPPGEDDGHDQYVDYNPVYRSPRHGIPIITTTPPPSTPATPRNRTPLVQVQSPYTPSTPSELHRHYDSTILSSPTPSEAQHAHAVVSRAFKQELPHKVADTLQEEEVELTEVAPATPPPSGLPDSGQTLEESPFHNSQALFVGKQDWYRNTTANSRSSQWAAGGPNPFEPQETGDMDTAQKQSGSMEEHDLPKYIPPKGTVRLLFRNCTTQDILFRIVPPVILAAVAAIVPMYMTILVGDAFGAFSYFPLDVRQSTPEDRSKLMADISHSCLILTLVGLAGWVVNCVMIGLWVRVGELIAHRLRGAVFESVMQRGMEWFDLGMGLKAEEFAENKEAVGEDAEENVGAGGLMSKFTRETDDVRIACGMNMGQSIQDTSTFLACFIMALIKSWRLTLVTTSAIPLLVIVQIITQIFVNPMFAAERRALAEASTNVERTTSAMPTVKAFNAQQMEVDKFEHGVEKARANFDGQAVVWSISAAFGNFVLMAMFIAGFWYGSGLVRSGEVSAATVMTVFWACLLGSASLQQFVPRLVQITRGKESMAGLVALMEAPTAAKGRVRPSSAHSEATLTNEVLSPTMSMFRSKIWTRSKPRTNKTASLALRKVKPNSAKGEFNLQGVTFAYPSRPETLALDNVTLFLPAGETTFVVGGSGSGKSTVAQLMLRLYPPDHGELTLDDQDVQYLDMGFTQEHVAAVQQGCILFDMSVHDNVAMGLAGLSYRKPENATRDQVVEACKMATMHEFISGLPQGYETKLGTKGASLSGGQKQRLAIARARLRDPTVLILDEATSALDATSRILVFEAIKRWRKNRTTIVITHDLSQIQNDDFLYLMKNGRIVEQGFRSDLILRETSEFGVMATIQAQVPFPSVDRDPWETADDLEVMLEDESKIRPDYLSLRPISRQSFRSHSRQSVVKSNACSTYLDILSDYHNTTGLPPKDRVPKRLSMLMAPGNRLSHRHSMVNMPDRLQTPSPLQTARPASSMARNYPLRSEVGGETDFMAMLEKSAGQISPSTASPLSYGRRQWIQEDESVSHMQIKIDGSTNTSPIPEAEFIQPSAAPSSIWTLLRTHLPSVPNKWLGVLGLTGAIGHGILTPLWSKEIALLMSAVSAGGDNKSYITTLSLRILGITVGDAAALGAQFFFLEKMAGDWIRMLRAKAFELVIAQPQSWFDRRENGSSRLVHTLVKDAEDMKPMVSTIIGHSTMVVVMIVAGIAWAMATGWKLTMVGLAVAPIFALITILQSRIIGLLEAKNKFSREQVSRTFYENVANVRGIRAMALEDTFRTRFSTDLVTTLRSGNVAAWGTGIGNGTGTALPYFVQALLIYVSAIFIVKGYYDFPTMMQVYSLVLFSVTFASQFMDFIPEIAKTKMATADFDRLRRLTTDTVEERGDLRFPITGHVKFEGVNFAYPSRPDVPILTGINFELQPGSCVAIVGASGSGKSTIAALLQRLYEPDQGSIRLDRFKLEQADVRWLRDHVAVVSQQANLFDATVAENIAYGTQAVSVDEIHRAAKVANVHDFIMSLPQGYRTNLGENASLISGGQAQRLQIARALIRRSNIMILDECTSALDPENQHAVLNTIMKVKEGKTAVFVTHKADVMRRCDRILCLEGGKIAEQGTWDELMRHRGVFARLMQAGEWE